MLQAALSSGTELLYEALNIETMTSFQKTAVKSFSHGAFWSGDEGMALWSGELDSSWTPVVLWTLRLLRWGNTIYRAVAWPEPQSVLPWETVRLSPCPSHITKGLTALVVQKEALKLQIEMYSALCAVIRGKQLQENHSTEDFKTS